MWLNFADVCEIFYSLIKVDCIVTTAGGIEEDFMKCWAPTHINSFEAVGASLRTKQINRIGNLVIPTRNYCLLDDWMTPILDQMLVEQKNDVLTSMFCWTTGGSRISTYEYRLNLVLLQGVLWTPSRMINRLGKEINNEDSMYYWAWKVFLI